ncbi:MAG: DUF5305 domain-containing protein, partial [Bacilli bacterium]|nr:DUF5305 domain-containing protein [Bacilli bacterium]
ILLAISILIAILDIIWILYELVTYTLNKDVKVKYQERLKKIFRDYGPYISRKAMTTNTKEIMYTMSLRVEIVNSFDDLINVRDSIEKPILFYEAIPGEQAVFYIIDTKVSYIYIMNARDCGKKNKNSSNIELVGSDDKKELTNTDNLIDGENEAIEEENIEELTQSEDIQEEIENVDSSEDETEKNDSKEVVEKAKKKKKKKKKKSKTASKATE